VHNQSVNAIKGFYHISYKHHKYCIEIISKTFSETIKNMRLNDLVKRISVHDVVAGYNYS